MKNNRIILSNSGRPDDKTLDISPKPGFPNNNFTP